MEKSQRGFSLLELVVTMVILGILSAIVAVYLRAPIQGYFDTARRAQLVQTADFALRRIARDLATAAPNSVRFDSGTHLFMEALQARTGGRFCGACDCTDPIIADATCATDVADKFSVVGPTVTVASGDSIVIGNLPGSGCDAYSATTPNRRSLTFVASPTALIQFTGGGFSSSCVEITGRFQVVSGPVSYACETGTSTLWRYSGYAIQATQPTTIAALNALASVVKAALATDVDCAATDFDASAVAEGLVQLRLQIKDSSGESINLYRQVKVDNTP